MFCQTYLLLLLVFFRIHIIKGKEHCNKNPESQELTSSQLPNSFRIFLVLTGKRVDISTSQSCFECLYKNSFFKCFTKSKDYSNVRCSWSLNKGVAVRCTAMPHSWKFTCNLQPTLRILDYFISVGSAQMQMVQCCCCSVTQSCLNLCNPTDCSTPGTPVLHHLLELAQIHVHWVMNDAIQPSHPLLLPSPSAFNLPQHQGLFQWVSSLHQVAKVFQIQHQSFQWIFRVDFL